MGFRQLVRNLRKAEERMQKECPEGHTNIDFVDLGHKYTFCYDCNKKYVRDDYLPGGNLNVKM